MTKILDRLEAAEPPRFPHRLASGRPELWSVLSGISVLLHTTVALATQSGPRDRRAGSDPAQRAVALQAHRAAPMILGYADLLHQQDEPALAEMERAVALAPQQAWAYAGLAQGLSMVGRTEEALRAAEQAQRLQTSGPADEYRLSVGIAYYFAGRPEEAMAPLKQYFARYPNILGARLTLAAVYSELGKDAEARAEAEEVLRLNPKFSLAMHKERALLKDPAVLERHIEALRRAGFK